MVVILIHTRLCMVLKHLSFVDPRTTLIGKAADNIEFADNIVKEKRPHKLGKRTNLSAFRALCFLVWPLDPLSEARLTVSVPAGNSYWLAEYLHTNFTFQALRDAILFEVSHFKFYHLI